MAFVIPPEIQTTITQAIGWLWDKYGQPVAEKATARVVDETKWKFGLEKYYTSLFERVGFVRILGRMESEPLENVFTHVNVLDKLTAEQRYDIAKLKAEFNPRDFGRLERVRRVSGDDAVAEFPKLFVLGKPGAGKTTFLKYTALRAIKHEIKKVPLFVTLKELSDSGMGIVEFMTHQLSVHRFPEPEAFLERLLENGDGLVLFDGLDEVNLEDNKRSKMIQQINDFVYRYSDCPTLMTCRVAATDYSFTQFEYVEMADFDAAQMARYIDLWFVGNETKRESFKKVLLEDDNYKPVRELAQVPLLLALLCLVYEERNEIPPERHEIYEEAMRALLSKWDASREISRDVVYQQLSLGRKQKMLAMIAAKTFEQGDYFLKEREVVRLVDDYLVGVPGLEEPDAEFVLRSLEAQHGVFVERARGIHSFSHLTLQEYFTARYIVDNESRGAVERLMDHVGDNRWDEVFLLVAGMLDDATEFIESYLRSVHRMMLDEKALLTLLNATVQKERIVTDIVLTHAGVRAIAQYLGFTLTFYSSDSAIDLSILLHLDLALTALYADKMESSLDFIYDFSDMNSRDPQLDELSTEHETVVNSVAILLESVYSARALAFSFIFSVFQALKTSITISSIRSGVPKKGFITFYSRALELAELSQLTNMRDDLKRLNTPDDNDEVEAWENFLGQIINTLKRHRNQWDNFYEFEISEDEVLKWKGLNIDQIGIWMTYNKANFLLVRCLQVAYVPNRQALEDKVLLPPELW